VTLAAAALLGACAGHEIAPPYDGTLPAATGPGEARKWRQLAWKDENGQIQAEAFRTALQQRRANVTFWIAHAVEQGLPVGVVQKAGMNPGAWVEHGPDNVGGRTRSLVIHPAQTNRMWAGAVSGGIWYSEDRGASWAPVDDWWASLAVGCMVIDPLDPDVMYAGTGEGFFNGDAIGGVGIYKSFDGGATWVQLPATANFGNVCRIAISPDDSNLLLAGTRYGGIRRSTNGGLTWATVRWAQGSYFVAFDPTNGQNAVAQIIDYDWDLNEWFHSALYSTDGGITWTEASGALSRVNGFGSRIELAHAPSSPGIVYASVAADGGKIWRSTDGGQSYAELTSSGSSGVNWYANPLWVDPTDADVLMTGGYNIYGSVNGGVTLTQISDGYIMTVQPHVDIHFFAHDPGYDGDQNRRFYVCTDGGVWEAQDLYAASPQGGWARRDQTYRTTLRLVDSDDQAILTFGGDGGFCAIHPTDPDYVYGEYINLRIHRSTNGGYSAGYIYNGIADAGVDANFIAPFILDPNDPDTMLAGGRSLWRSTNVKQGTPAWSAIKGPGSDRISAIAVAPGNPDIIWVGQNNGEIHKTSNGTAGLPDWSAVDDNGAANPLPDRYVTRIVIDPDDSDVAFVSLGGFSTDNLQKTSDGGASWTDITGAGPTGLPEVPVRGIARHPTQPNWLYVGTEVGVFASDDGGATWSTSDFGPAAVSVDEVVFMHHSKRLLAATHGRGLFTIPIGNPGDLNGDGVIDVNDFLVLLGSWGPCPPEGGCPADLDGDGMVGVTDFLAMLRYWG
jgi:hypothetical protein